MNTGTLTLHSQETIYVYVDTALMRQAKPAYIVKLADGQILRCAEVAPVQLTQRCEPLHEDGPMCFGTAVGQIVIRFETEQIHN